MRGERESDSGRVTKNNERPSYKRDAYCDGCWDPGVVWTGDGFLCKNHARTYGMIGDE